MDNFDIVKYQQLINNYNNLLEQFEKRKKNMFNPFTLGLFALPLIFFILLFILSYFYPQANSIIFILIMIILFGVCLIGKSIVNTKKREELTQIEDNIKQSKDIGYNFICEYLSNCFGLTIDRIKAELEILNFQYPQLLSKNEFKYRYDKTKNKQKIIYYDFWLSMPQIETIKELLNEKFNK